MGIGSIILVQLVKFFMTEIFLLKACKKSGEEDFEEILLLMYWVYSFGSYLIVLIKYISIYTVPLILIIILLLILLLVLIYLSGTSITVTTYTNTIR